jgi:hypothetical protein
MAFSEAAGPRAPTHAGDVQWRRSLEVITSGSAVEALGGAGVVVLTILGLAGVLPTVLVAIATIALGAALVFEGGAIGARYSKLLSETGASPAGAVEIGGGMTAEFFGGAAGITLGLLALLNVAPGTLTAAAVIVFGGALLFGSGTTARLNSMEVASAEEHRIRREVWHAAMAGTTGAQVLVGIAGIVLGILALVSISPLMLTLVGLLALGACVLLSGSLVGSAMMAALHESPRA